MRPPQTVLRSILQIEYHHRTRTSCDYHGCDERPCPWCRFIRPWAAYKMEELGMQHDGDDLASEYLCRQCAKAAGGIVLDQHATTTHLGKCSQCRMLRKVSHWSNFDWLDQDRDINARLVRAPHQKAMKDDNM